MVSLAQGNTLRKSAFWYGIYVKDSRGVTKTYPRVIRPELSSEMPETIQPNKPIPIKIR